ncbi:MAG: GNAT family N-acetyltransferase [Polyangiales bacterium]
MNASTQASRVDVAIRPLAPSDLDAVVALDERITGKPRRAYFERRLRAALRQPKRHLQLAAATDAGLVGFLLARRAGGEYGRPEEAVVLEAIGVDPRNQGAHLGRRMLDALEALMRSRGIPSLVTQVDWRNGRMMEFLARTGFSLAPRHMIERSVHRMPLPKTDEEIELSPPLVRHLRADDLAAIARIDRAITGDDRTEYLRRKTDEVVNESAIMVSLVAEDDGFPVAFAMVRVDYGDFGHVEPTAALDTIGVSPGFGNKGFARAVLTQVIDNLAALHVERLETEVPQDNFELLRFLYKFGFAPSKRLSFERSIAVSH